MKRRARTRLLNRIRGKSNDKNLQLSAEEMRQLGYQAVDLIVDHMNHLKVNQFQKRLIVIFLETS